MKFKASLVIAPPPPTPATPPPPPTTPSVIRTLWVRKSICDSPLNKMSKPIYCLIYCLARWVVVITTAQLHSTKPEFKLFSAGSIPACG